MNNCFKEKYSVNFGTKNVANIFDNGSKFTNVVIDRDLLKNLEIVADESFGYTFNSYRDYDKFMLKMRRKLKYNLVISKTKLFAHYRVLISENRVVRNYEFEKFMRIKGARSRSGVISVTIFTSGSVMGSDNEELVQTGGCPMNCHYCPFEKDSSGIPTQPRSYLSTEPGNKRATENLHHPLGQVYSRMFQLESIGHLTNSNSISNKIELIVSGGTFNFYPKEYLE